MKKYFIIVVGVLLLATSCQKAKKSDTTDESYQASNSNSSPKPATSDKSTIKLKVFVIAPEDNGKSGKLIGCGDSVVPLEREVVQTPTPLKASLEALLAIKGDYVGESGLYNALGSSDLKLDSVVIKDGKAIIKLSGKLTVGGVCDNPRIDAQIRETAMQFSSVKSVEVFVDNKPLTEILSGKGATIKVKLYFAEKGKQQLECNQVVAVEREIGKTTKVATAVLEELLKGPTTSEKQKGLISQIPAGSKLNSLTIVNGEARADFNQATEMGGGSCAQGIVTTQIRQTLLQFPTVKSVKLSIDGSTENIFQP